MGMQINILNTDELTDQDRQVLAVLAGTSVALKGENPGADEAAAERAAQAAALAKRAEAASKPPAKKAAPKPKPKAAEPEEADEESEEEESDPDSTDIEAAIAKATELVTAGRAKDVKAVLNTLGVAKVSELEGDDIAKFLAELDD